MSKPLNENLRSVQVRDDQDDLHPLLDYAGDQFSKLVRAVTESGKVGTLTLKIDVKPSTAGALAIKADVGLRLPKVLPAESLLWPTPEGNLETSDPKQGKLELKGVPAEPVRTIRESNAA